MRTDEQALASTYRQYSDEEVAALAAEFDTLTDAARVTLKAEIDRRGMSSAQLAKLHSRELHREARVDQLESLRRKKTALYLLTRNDPKGTIAIIVIALGFAAYVWLRSLFH
jgi:hypothetical protein